jgi:hypothetical protein
MIQHVVPDANSEAASSAATALLIDKCYVHL